jgi:hypothetical protein
MMSPMSLACQSSNLLPIQINREWGHPLKGRSFGTDVGEILQKQLKGVVKKLIRHILLGEAFGRKDEP